MVYNIEKMKLFRTAQSFNNNIECDRNIESCYQNPTMHRAAYNLIMRTKTGCFKSCYSSHLKKFILVFFKSHFSVSLVL